MTSGTFVNETLAHGLRKRITRESFADVIYRLQQTVDVARLGTQRNGPVFRRVSKHLKTALRDYTIHRRFIANAKRRVVFEAELLLPEDGDEPEEGGLAIHRLVLLRKSPSNFEIQPIGVRVSKHAIERILMRKNDSSCEVVQIVRELSPTLEILTHWVDEHLIRREGAWCLPTDLGLSMVVSEGRNQMVNITTWVREDQLTEKQFTSRTEILDRLGAYKRTGDSRSMRVVCGPDTPCVCQDQTQ